MTDQQQIDIALTSVGNKVVVHTASCPEARMMAALGYPVATLLGCKEMPDQSLPRHSCMEKTQ